MSGEQLRGRYKDTPGWTKSALCSKKAHCRPAPRLSEQRRSLKAEEAVCDSYDMDMQPDDIELDDTVTVIWEIA